MTSYGYFLSSEQYSPRELLDQARRAEDAGFERLWISDHFHPWNDAQGQSPFVWGLLGALSQVTSLPVTTAVTSPIIRIHPAILAQATATASVLLDGRFVFGVGTGEALNDHVLGDPWPPVGERFEMLEEAIGIIRRMHEGGVVNHRGKHYRVTDARIYTLPEQPVPIYVSGFGEQATELAARIGDGYCGVAPDASLLETYRSTGGQGPTQGGTKVCWGDDREAMIDHAHRMWPNDGFPGQLAQTLPRPSDFEDAAQLLARDAVPGLFSCGSDVDEHVGQLRSYADAGYDEVYVQQIGPDVEGFFAAYAKEVLPALRG
ncbi:LLM class F420-dependent oxidoreductase [Actinomycetospora corticicola]|uniref:G6PDH family F420-dependent oxidoreductase n=1 Tax=Actinomycetospora corticicola TaxID=663602 RepID=A0A7Y9E0P1_9PSEU|nr:TIGR03557 family F420-dependent LLM class oxidoreductase [Actinomycetospora corticicola]NYD38762.1 G6PDH family F420-dependent oxidoreductase [Actinomycetospora corticicola]